MMRSAGYGLRLLLRRAAQALLLSLTVSSLCFVIARSLPGDIATRIAASRYGYDLVSNAAADAVRAELGLNAPAWQALLHWWQDLLTGGLGQSLLTGEPVLQALAAPLHATVLLTGVALALALAIGLPPGLWAGLHPHSRVDRLILGLSALLRAMPPFLVAVLLMLAMAVQFGVLPVAGDTGAGVWLPALTLALGLGAGLAQISRNALQRALQLPSHEFARTKGLSTASALLHHGLRNAALPVVAWLGTQTVLLAEGSVVVESLFAWPGIGHELVHAVFGRDIPMLQGAALCMGVLFVGLNLLVDTACLALDPRLREGPAQDATP